MNLFWKKLFGGLQSTASIERKADEIVQIQARFKEVLSSKELARYSELKKIVNSPSFKQKRTDYTKGSFKSTPQYSDFQKCRKYDTDSKLKKYYATLNSAMLAEYLDFKSSENYRLISNPEEVKKSAKLKEYKKFENSSEYKNYLNLHHSFAVKEHTKLKELIASPQFMEVKQFWDDPNRWQRTPEYQFEKEYLDLSNSSDIMFYEKNNAELSSQKAAWDLVFEENFSDGTLDTNKWFAGLYQGQKLMNAGYSFANEKQANTGGENLVIAGGMLTIATRTDQIETRAWDEKRGFIPKTFQYTSDVINGSKAVQIKGGLIQAKVKVAGSKDITHAFWLGAKNRVPHVNLFLFDGKSIKMGNFWNEQGFLRDQQVSVTGLNPHQFYIYSLEWTNKEMIWKINNIEVLRTVKGIPAEDMYPVFNSFISKTQQGGIGEFNIDWIKVYKKAI